MREPQRLGQNLGQHLTQLLSESAGQKVCACGQAIEPIGKVPFIYIPKLCPQCLVETEASEKIEDLRNARLQKRDRLRNALKRKPSPLCEEIIPPLFETAHLRHVSSALKTVMLHLPPDKGLYLWGPVGCGKSYAMCALIRHYVVSGYNVGRVLYARLLREIRGCYNGQGSETAILKWAESVHKLFIEDLSITSANQETDFAMRTFLEILDYRLEHRLPVFVTGNKSPDEIEQSFGERIGSRLQVACIILPVGGRDKRRVAAKAGGKNEA